MNTPSETLRIPFNQLMHFFPNTSDKILQLDSSIGEGGVQLFSLEEGLQARVWDCRFTEGIEIYNSADTNTGDSWFVLTYFLDTEGLQLDSSNNEGGEHLLWDCLFLSTASHHRLHIAPMASVRCLSISFSKSWLCRMLESNEALNKLKELLCATDSLLQPGVMTLPEKKMVQELVSSTWQKQLGSFYIKSAVLNMVSDFLYKLQERDDLFTTQTYAADIVTEVEHCLTENVTGSLPDLKALAHSFTVSECTLKRQFKKRYGVTMSVYFTQKKMEYARQLMLEKGITEKEAARLVGYQNLHNFHLMFKKHHEHRIPLENYIASVG